jgi:hypothetical protein
MRTLGMIVALVLVTSIASAQTADDLRGRLKVGQKVSVTDDQGRELKGSITILTADTLTITSGRDRTDVPYARVVRVDRKDGLKNGALIGLGTGAVLGVLAIIPDCDPQEFLCGDPGAGNYLAGALVVGGLGAAIGTGLDALIGGDQNIYRRGLTITASPTIGPHRAGASLAIVW